MNKDELLILSEFIIYIHTKELSEVDGLFEFMDLNKSLLDIQFLSLYVSKYLSERNDVEQMKILIYYTIIEKKYNKYFLSIITNEYMKNVIEPIIFNFPTTMDYSFINQLLNDINIDNGLICGLFYYLYEQKPDNRLFSQYFKIEPKPINVNMSEYIKIIYLNLKQKCQIQIDIVETSFDNFISLGNINNKIKTNYDFIYPNILTLINPDILTLTPKASRSGGRSGAGGGSRSGGVAGGGGGSGSSSSAPPPAPPLPTATVTATDEARGGGRGRAVTVAVGRGRGRGKGGGGS